MQESLAQMKALNADLKAQGEDKDNVDRIALASNMARAYRVLGDTRGCWRRLRWQA